MTEPLEHASETTPPAVLENSRRTALVLGGGGSAGNAWLIGILAGLCDAGLDVTTADVTIGTSAGSTTAAQLAGATATELFAATLAPVPQHRTGTAGAGRPKAAAGAAGNQHHIDRRNALITASADAADMRRRMGSEALQQEAASDGAVQAQWRATVAARLPGQQWPERRLLITAVDARTGDPVVFDRDSGVELVDAVAASCSSGFAYSIGDGSYIDGGFRSNAENADLAAGYARVLVLSPFGGRSLQPKEWGTDLATQVEELRAGGSRVEIVVPDAGARDIFATGGNVMDPTARVPAARAGYEQGNALADRLIDFWR